MNKPSERVTPRREFIKSTVGFAAASALAGVAIPHVFAGRGQHDPTGLDRLRRPRQRGRGQCHVGRRAGAGWRIER